MTRSLHPPCAGSASVARTARSAGGHAPVAPNDPTLCAAHRAESDAMVMPWEVTA